MCPLDMNAYKYVCMHIPSGYHAVSAKSIKNTFCNIEGGTIRKQTNKKIPIKATYVLVHRQTFKTV